MKILYHPKRILGFEPYVAPEGFDRKAQPVDIYDVFERYYRNHRTAKYIYSVDDSFTNQGLSADELPLQDGTSYLYSYELAGTRYSFNVGSTAMASAIGAGNYDTITVISTEGFPSSGKIAVGSNARVNNVSYPKYFVYTHKDETHFYGSSQYLNPGSGNRVDYIIPFVGTKRYVITNNTSMTSMLCWVQGYTGITWMYCGNYINYIMTSNTNAIPSSIKYIHIHKIDNIVTYAYCAHYYAPLTGKLNLSNNADIIDANAFRNCSLISGELYIPDNIQSIGYMAFLRCGLITSLRISQNCTSIGFNAFERCVELNGTLTIPNSCTTIEYNAFYFCNKLDTLDLGTGVQTIGNSAFQGCSQLSGTLTFPTSLITIGNSAFQSCTSFTALSLSSSITTIGALAFYGCAGMTGTITIPSGITSIGQGAFGDGNFTDIDVTANSRYEDVDDVLYEISTRTALHSVKSYTGTITFQTNTLIIGDYCCLRNQRTGTLTVPDSVTRVGIYAFYDCNGFTAISLEASSSSLATIDDYAFSHCSNLAGTLTLPNSVTLVDAGAFQYDVLISAIVFGSGLVTIGANAFRQMTAISENLAIPNSVETIGATAFYNNTARTGTLTLGTGLKTIGGQAFGNVPFTGTLTIPSAVTAIGEGAFFINNFSAVASSASGFTVSDYVLYDETVSGQIKAHTSVRGYSGTLTFKAGTTSILYGCFHENDNRSGSITIPYTVTSIGQSAFQGCGGFNAAVVIGDGTNGSALTTIGYLAFYDVDNVTRYDFYRTPAPLCNTSGSFGASPAKELHITSGATGYDVTPATAAAPWTNTAIFSSVTADL